MTQQTTQKMRTRARILDEAARALRALGHDGIGVAALMKRAGLTHGGFYAHFADRDEMVAHAVDRMFGDSDAMLRDWLGTDDARRGLERLIDGYLSEAVRLAPDAGCPLPSLGGSAPRLAAAARERFSAGILAFRTALEGSLEVTGHDDPASLASSVLSEMVGAMTLARALGDDAVARSLLADCRRQLKSRLLLATDAPA